MSNLSDATESGIADADPVELLVADYLRGAGGDPHLALRRAAVDVLREAVDAQLAAIRLNRAASSGYLRRLPEAVRDGAARATIPAETAGSTPL